MDTMLMVVTGMALACAAGMGLLLARMMRDERRRSDARVQLLTEMASETAPVAAHARTPGTMRPVPAVPAAVALGDLTMRPGDLFHAHAEPSAWPRRVAVVGAMAALLILTVVGYRGYRQMTSSERLATPRVAALAQGTAPTAAAPLELLSLRHAQDDGVLTVTGLVQNPRSGVMLSRVSVTLFVFGAGGTFITSGRVPVDFTSLTPGDESSFVIRVPVSRAVERYRVGFRDADDRTLAHVDRRSADPIAQK